MGQSNVSKKKIYGDEEIIKLLNEYKKGVQGDIYSGYIIREDFHKFVQRDIFENKLSMFVPLRFKKMEIEEMQSMILPERFDVLYVNSKGNIQLAFKLIDVKITWEELKNSVEKIKEGIKTVSPSSSFYDSGIIKIDGGTGVKWFDYKNVYNSSSVYMLCFYLQVMGKMLDGKFLCDYRKAKYWKPIFLEMLNTIEVNNF